LQEWEILDVLEFNSTRKRMSVVVRDPSSGNLQVLSKGADMVMLPLLNGGGTIDQLHARLDLDQQHAGGATMPHATPWHDQPSSSVEVHAASAIEQTETETETERAERVVCETLLWMDQYAEEGLRTLVVAVSLWAFSRCKCCGFVCS
jgi:magnesium-transporting ATPase (P-type)